MRDAYGEKCFSKNKTKQKKKTIHGMETHWPSRKEKVTGSVVSKKVILTMFRDMKVTFKKVPV